MARPSKSMGAPPADVEPAASPADDSAPQGTNGAVEAKDAELADESTVAPKVSATVLPPAAPSQAPSGPRLCRVVGSPVYADGKNYAEGDEAIFSAADIASAPGNLVPIEQ